MSSSATAMLAARAKRRSDLPEACRCASPPQDVDPVQEPKDEGADEGEPRHARLEPDLEQIVVGVIDVDADEMTSSGCSKIP